MNGMKALPKHWNVLGWLCQRNVCSPDPFGAFTYKEEIDAFLDTLPAMPEAFVCVSDYVACILMQLLLKRGFRIPEDVAVSGFDGNMESRWRRS